MEQSDIVERLKACANGVGSFKTERGDFGLCDEAADEITRLRAALADAQAVGFAAGVEAAAKKADPDGWEPECCRDMRIAIAHHIRAIAGDTP